MFAEIIAIGAAMGWAVDSVLVRIGLRRSDIFVAMLMSFGVCTVCIWSYLIATTSLEFLKSPALVYYLISGCMQPLLARALFYEGVNRIGVARAGALRGIEPLFATVIAVMVLREQPGAPVYLGTVLVVISLWLISGKPQPGSMWRLRDSVLPVVAALISAVSQTLRKQGLKILPDPFVAVAVVTPVSLILLLVFSFTTQRTGMFRVERRSFLFFLAAGLTATLAQVANFVALGRGDLSVMIPLLNTTPLFSSIFAATFLRQFETVTARIALGAALMVTGVVLITGR